MKFLKYLQATAAMAAVTLSLCACGGDEDEPEDDITDGNEQVVPTPDPEPTPEPNPDVEAMDPDAAKAYIEQTALEIVNTVNPADQDKLLLVVNHWVENYSSIDPPVEWNLDAFFGYDDEDDYYRARRHNPIKGFMTALGRAAKGDVSAVSRAMSELMNMARFSGIYEPGGVYVDEDGDTYHVWKKTADSNDVVFRFPYNGSTVEARGVAEGSTWSGSLNGITVEIPRKLTATLKNNGNELVNVVLESNLDFNAHTLQADLTGALMNINVKTVTSGTNSKITSDSYVWYSGKQLTHTVGVINGVNMIDKNALKNLFREETETWGDYTETFYTIDGKAVGNMFKSGEIESDVVGKIRVAGTINNTGELIESFGEYFDRDAYSDRDAAEQACRVQCELLNRSMPADMYLAGSSYSSATIKYQPYLEDDIVFWEWYSEPVMAFADGTTSSLAGYFGGKNFISLDTPIRNIVNTFVGYWPFVTDYDE